MTIQPVMTLRPPPNGPLVRSIHYLHWESAKSLFDGVHPVLVHSTRRANEYWSFHIELWDDTPMCITRLNGNVLDKFMLSAALPPK